MKLCTCACGWSCFSWCAVASFVSFDYGSMRMLAQRRRFDRAGLENSEQIVSRLADLMLLASPLQNKCSHCSVCCSRLAIVFVKPPSYDLAVSSIGKEPKYFPKGTLASLGVFSFCSLFPSLSCRFRVGEPPARACSFTRELFLLPTILFRRSELFVCPSLWRRACTLTRDSVLPLLIVFRRSEPPACPS